MHLILIGATGLVGSATLNAMLHNPSITRVSIFARSQVPQAIDTESAVAKCTVYQHPNFAQPPDDDILRNLHDAHGLIWALGVSTNQVNATFYREVTVDWPVIWAKAMKHLQLEGGNHQRDAFNFIYVSGEGATTQPGLLTPAYARVKAEAETALLSLAGGASSNFSVYSARAGAVDRADHPEIAKYVAAREGLQQKLEKPVKVLLKKVHKGILSPSRQLGEVLVQLAAGDSRPLAAGAGVEGDGWIVGNAALRRLGGL